MHDPLYRLNRSRVSHGCVSQIGQVLLPRLENRSTVNIGDGATLHNARIQDNGGQINITSNAVVSGGNISITNGSLNFLEMAFYHGDDSASEAFSSTLYLNGKSDTIEFGGAIGPLTLGINIPLKEIAVFNMGEKIADLHLGPSALGAYSAADFSVKGDQLLYHHS